MIVFSGEDFKNIYLDLLTTVESTGEIIGKSKSIYDVCIELNNPIKSLLPLRKNWGWSFTELLDRFSIGGNPGTAYIFRPNWRKKLEKESGTFCYSYSEIYTNQLNQVIKPLKLGYRESILSVWNHKYLDIKEYLRRPCTLTHQFYITPDKKLNLLTNMRVVDIMNMLTYDIFHHSMLLRYVARLKNLDIGKFTLISPQMYYQKKRDVTHSVLNTIEKLKTNKPISYESAPIFDTEDLNLLIKLNKKLFNSKETISATVNEEFLDETLNLKTDYSTNYIAFLVNCYCKLRKEPLIYNLEETPEFNLLKYK